MKSQQLSYNATKNHFRKKEYYHFVTKQTMGIKNLRSSPICSMMMSYHNNDLGVILINLLILNVNRFASTNIFFKDTTCFASLKELNFASTSI